jgi:putative transposase
MGGQKAAILAQVGQVYFGAVGQFYIGVNRSVILHSDRGCQFTSGDYQRFLNRNALLCSMSSVGHCGDNAACEGFFGVLKRDRANHRRYRTRDEARADLFDYIERFHNPRMRRRVATQDLKFSNLSKPSAEAG